MKKQKKPSIKAQIIRSAFILLAFTAIAAIPFALGQRQATRRSAGKSNTPQLPAIAGNPAALSNADLPRDMVPKQPVLPFVYTEKAPYPASVGLDRHATASDGTYIYVIGGEAYNGATYTVTSVVYRYDPVGNTWTSLASLPGPYDNSEACGGHRDAHVLVGRRHRQARPASDDHPRGVHRHHRAV